MQTSRKYPGRTCQYELRNDAMSSTNPSDCTKRAYSLRGLDQTGLELFLALIFTAVLPRFIAGAVHGRRDSPPCMSLLLLSPVNVEFPSSSLPCLALSRPPSLLHRAIWSLCRLSICSRNEKKHVGRFGWSCSVFDGRSKATIEGNNYLGVA